MTTIIPTDEATSDLADHIDATRITYPERDGGITIRGSPIGIEFTESIQPKAFCDAITTAAKPWQMFGLVTPISDNDYWKVVGTLFHIEDGRAVDASSITLEVTADWARVYVKDDCDAHRAAEFIQTIDDVYGVTAEFVTHDTEDNPTHE